MTGYPVSLSISKNVDFQQTTSVFTEPELLQMMKQANNATKYYMNADAYVIRKMPINMKY